jgi:hypothetical protein
MSIETIIATREALLKDIEKGLSFAKPKAGDLQRPIAQQESYIASLSDRIDALEALRKQQNDRIDSDVEVLTADLKAAKHRLETDRKTLGDSAKPEKRPAADTAPSKQDTKSSSRRTTAGKRDRE